MSLKTVGTYTAIVLGTLIGAEAVARIWDWAPPVRENLVDDGVGRWRYEHGHGGYGDLTPNQNGHWLIWFHRPYHVQTNSVGLRNSEEPSSSAFRVLALGDSQTFGPYLANEDTWPGWTENYLRRHYGSDARVQVFNAGIAGYTIIDELAYLKQKGVAFSPSLVLLAVFENDLGDLRAERENTVRRRTREAPYQIEVMYKDFVRKLALASVFDKTRDSVNRSLAGVDVQRGEGAAGVAPQQPSTDTERLRTRYRGLFLETVELLKSKNIPLAVFFIPSADKFEPGAKSEMEPIIRALTAETATPYLDLTETMRREPDAQVRLYLLQKSVASGLTGNGHLSREGNAVVGKAITDWLAEAQLIPRR